MQLSGSDLRLLKVFDAVVRNRGYSAAEAELNISASTISNHMTALEQRLGITLCRRGRAGFKLTEKGEAIHEAVRRLLASTLEFNTELERARGDVKEFRVGLVDSMANDPNCRVAEAIGRLKLRIPRLYLVMTQDPPQDLQVKVREGEYDCGIGSFPLMISGLDHLPLYTELNLLYVGAGHPLFEEDPDRLDPDLLQRHETIRRRYWRDRDDRRFKLGPVAAVVDQIEPQLILLLSGRYTGFLPTHVAAPWVEAGRLRALRPDVFVYRCSFDFITRKGAPRSDALRQFERLCAEAHSR